MKIILAYIRRFFYCLTHFGCCELTEYKSGKVMFVAACRGNNVVKIFYKADGYIAQWWKLRK